MTAPSATESTLVDIEELEALAKAATPGEWRAGVNDTDCVFGDSNNPALMAPQFGRVLLRTNHHFPVFEADARFIAAANPSTMLALLREVRASRAAGEPEPEWEPLHDADGMLRVDEGNTYLFAIETNQGWEYFQDAIVWDSESDPRWYDGDAGWEIDDVTHFRALPTPPQSEPAATTEGT